MAIYESYEVQSGDTLSTIAQRFRTDSESIARWSGLSNKNMIRPGQSLNVRQVSETYHIIAVGESLSSIAIRYGITEGELQRVNGIANASKILAGSRLIIPTAGVVPIASRTSPARPLGALSKAYEVASGGAGTVSKGEGDHGGVSYGSFQLSSKFNRPNEFLATEGRPWAAEFAGTTQGTDSFSAAWKAVAAREPERFEQAQHQFIKRTHYDVQAKLVATRTGVDVDRRSRTLRDVVWSTAVQHGPSTSLIVDVIDSLGITPAEPGFEKVLIMSIYGERGRRDADGKLHYFRSSSGAFQDGVAHRFGREVKDALDNLAAETALRLAAQALPKPRTDETAKVVEIVPPMVQPTSAAPEDAAAVVKRAAGKLSDDDIRLIVDKYGDTEANAEFLAGKKVLLSLRKNTNTRQYRKGCYDDLLLIVQRLPVGTVKLARMPINTEPAGEYAFDGTNPHRSMYGVDTDRDGRKELGRLVAGTYHYTRQPGLFLNAPFFKARDIQVTQRDTNQDGNFGPGDYIDKEGAGRTMYIHRGGAEGVATWSAGCQTVPKNRYDAFLAAVAGQDKLSYILIDAS